MNREETLKKLSADMAKASAKLKDDMWRDFRGGKWTRKYRLQLERAREQNHSR